MTKQLNSIFLTGATGVLGARLLKELLLRGDTHIFCLVRAKSLTEGQERLRSFLRIYDTESKTIAAFETRVTAVLGDVRSEHLGLTEEEHHHLQKQVDLTIHAAANTNLLAKWKNIEPINVGGTHNVIEFCLGTKNKALSYVSTYTVVGSRGFDSTLVFRETDLDVGQTFEHLSYQQSKFNAEKLIHSSTERGLNWKIFRPGQIFGDSRTGHYPQGETKVSGLFYDIFKTSIETNIALNCSNYFFDVVPVDYVSKGIVRLSLDRTQTHETYHLTNPDLKSFQQVLQLVADQGYPITFVSEAHFQNRLVENGFHKNGEPYHSSALLAFRWWYFKAGFSFENSSVIDCTFTKSVLEPLGLTCPKIDHELIATYTRFCINNGYFPGPAEEKPKLDFDRAVALSGV